MNDKFNLNNEIIDSINKIAKKYDVVKITLFGSRARGDNKNTSDIDLAVYCAAEEDNSKSEIYFALDDIDTLLKFDILFMDNNTDEKLKRNIEREGVVIYERK